MDDPPITTTSPLGAGTTGTGVGRAGAERHVAVVGAGLGGLLVAVGLADDGHRVTLVGDGPDGGRARADRRGDFVFNRGPRALYVDGPADRALRGVGVDTSAGAPPVLAGAGARHAGALHRFPASATDVARTTLLRPREKLALVRTLAAVASGVGDVDGWSVAEWLDRRGIGGTVRSLVEALVRLATYVDGPDVLPAGVALRAVAAGVRPGVRYLDGGWQSLVDQLAARARTAGVVRLDAKVDRLVDGPAGFEVHAGGRRVEAGAVVLAVGGPEAAASLLGGVPASWPALGPPAGAACLELGLRRLPPRRFVLGIDEPTYLSTHGPPARLAPQGRAVVHVMRYRGPDDAWSADEVRGQLHQLAAAAGVAHRDVVEERFLARMPVTGAVPQPTADGTLGRPGVAVVERPGVFVVGDWVGARGLLADAVAASATEARRLVGERSATMVR